MSVPLLLCQVDRRDRQIAALLNILYEIDEHQTHRAQILKALASSATLGITKPDDGKLGTYTTAAEDWGEQMVGKRTLPEAFVDDVDSVMQAVEGE